MHASFASQVIISIYFPITTLNFFCYGLSNFSKILNLFIVSFTRNRYIASTVNILIVIPSCMFSGVFWDFNVMPDYLQRIGKLMPQRLVYKAIEKLQVYNSLSYIKEYILYMILISFIFFFLSLLMFKAKKTN